MDQSRFISYRWDSVQLPPEYSTPPPEYCRTPPEISDVLAPHPGVRQALASPGSGVGGSECVRHPRTGSNPSTSSEFCTAPVGEEPFSNFVFFGVLRNFFRINFVFLDHFGLRALHCKATKMHQWNQAAYHQGSGHRDNGAAKDARDFQEFQAMKRMQRKLSTATVSGIINFGELGHLQLDKTRNLIQEVCKDVD